MTEAARVIAGGVAALAEAGVVRPLPLRTVRRIAAARRHLGESLATVVAIGAARWPDRPAIIDDDEQITYAQLHARTAALAMSLRDRHGVGPHRSVAILCRNHRGLLEAATAASRLGADILLLHTDFAGPQLADVLTRERAGVLVADAEFLASLGDAPPVIVADGAPGDHASLDALAAGPPPDRAPRPERASRLTILTSGTTGRPKGAQRAVGGLDVLGVLASVLHRLRLRGGDPLLVCVPLFHGYGFALSILAFVLGSPLVLRRRFDAEDVLRAVAAHRVAALALVPVMLQRLLALPDDPAARASLRAVLSGAAPLDPALATRALGAWGDVLFNGYGSSEVGIATVATPADLRDDPGSVGRPVLGATVRVVDAEGVTAPIGVTGRVFVGSGMLFTGYTGGDGAGRSDDRLGGLVATGDVGHLDEAGRLSIDGRADDMIVSGGENVYPQEVEEALAAHPAIADVAVLGVDDAEFGQRLVAWVVRADGAELTEEDVRAHVRDRLARYKVPRDIVFLDELPRGATGKVARRALPGWRG